MAKILGIDVGGTKIAAGLVDAKGHFSEYKLFRTSQTELVKQLLEIIISYKNVSGIGLAVPGRVLENGFVKRLPNVQNFKPTNFKLLLEKKFKVPVKVVNDAKAFALAEAILGSAKNFNSVAGVILGTGIGVGLVNHRKIYFGANSLSGEFGHVLLPNGQAFEEYVRSAGRFRSAKQAGKFLKMLLSFIVRSVDPEIIVFGGGWSNLPGMEKELQTQLRNVYHSKLKTILKISKLKHAGIKGAVLAFLKR